MGPRRPVHQSSGVTPSGLPVQVSERLGHRGPSLTRPIWAIATMGLGHTALDPLRWDQQPTGGIGVRPCISVPTSSLPYALCVYARGDHHTGIGGYTHIAELDNLYGALQLATTLGM